MKMENMQGPSVPDNEDEKVSVHETGASDVNGNDSQESEKKLFSTFEEFSQAHGGIEEGDIIVGQKTKDNPDDTVEFTVKNVVYDEKKAGGGYIELHREGYEISKVKQPFKKVIDQQHLIHEVIKKEKQTEDAASGDDSVHETSQAFNPKEVFTQEDAYGQLEGDEAEKSTSQEIVGATEINVKEDPAKEDQVSEDDSTSDSSEAPDSKESFTQEDAYGQLEGDEAEKSTSQEIVQAEEIKGSKEQLDNIQPDRADDEIIDAEAVTQEERNSAMRARSRIEEIKEGYELSNEERAMVMRAVSERADEASANPGRLKQYAGLMEKELDYAKALEGGLLNKLTMTGKLYRTFDVRMHMIPSRESGQAKSGFREEVIRFVKFVGSIFSREPWRNLIEARSEAAEALMFAAGKENDLANKTFLQELALEYAALNEKDIKLYQNPPWHERALRQVPSLLKKVMSGAWKLVKTAGVMGYGILRKKMESTSEPEVSETTQEEEKKKKKQQKKEAKKQAKKDRKKSKKKKANKASDG